jgi:hypothetical protein
MRNKKAPLPETPEQTLVRMFERNGCLRVPNQERKKAEPRTYKMGYEIRLVAFTKREFTELQRAIRAIGLKLGKPYTNVNRWVQPIYGRPAAEYFVALLAKKGSKGSKHARAGWLKDQPALAKKKANQRRARKAAK